jgi:CheY-like chemotaxis protein
MALDGLRMLVIEDVTDIRDVLVLLLRDEGADVVAAGSGREGVEIAKREQFHVVLCDLGLPDIGGDTLIREMRSATRERRVLVIATTGYGEPHVSRARDAGADAVFIKPINWPDLVEYIRQSGTIAA